jgi:methionine-rich copper-binding protein CopC
MKGDPPVDSDFVNTSAARLGAAIAGTLLVLTLAAPVLAHAELVASSPADGAVLDASPSEVVLRFSEALDAGKSRFNLEGPDGSVGIGRADADAPRVMRLEGLALAPGTYTVEMTVASPDGHIERPTISFAVTTAPASPSEDPSETPTEAPSDAPSGAPSEAPSASAGPSAAPSASAGPDTDPASGTSTDVLLPIVVGLLLAAGAGAYVLRRSRSA